MFVARDGRAGIESLTDLLTAAYFHMDEEGCHNHTEPLRDFRMKAECRAARLFEDRDAADRRQIARAIEHELLHRIEPAPDDGERIADPGPQDHCLVRPDLAAARRTRAATGAVHEGEFDAMGRHRAGEAAQRPRAAQGVGDADVRAEQRPP